MNNMIRIQTHTLSLVMDDLRRLRLARRSWADHWRGASAGVLAGLCACLILAQPLQAQTQSPIETFAGRGRTAPFGDGGPAISASLASPHGVAVDSLGNLYIADADNHRVRRVDALGTISTVVGTGELDFGGDGGPAVSASLAFPQDVAVDGLGNLYIADTANHRVRLVDESGTISTIAGTGERSFNGDGGPAVSAALWAPFGVAVDSLGNLYIADAHNHRVRRVDASGTITTIAGTGQFGFGGDAGPAVSASLTHPHGVTLDSLGNLYIADSYNHRVRRVDASGTITTVAGTGERGFSGDGGPAVSAALLYPLDVVADGFGNLYVSDYRRVRRVAPSGLISTVAGTGEFGFDGDGGPAASAALRDPHGVAVDHLGNLYIADRTNDRVRRVRLAHDGSEEPPLTDPHTPLYGWTVSDGGVRFLSLFPGPNHCIALSSFTLNAVSYTIHTSKWQRKVDWGSAWMDVEGTARTGTLCAYSPSQSGRFRGVAEISIGGTRGKYATENTLRVQ